MPNEKESQGGCPTHGPYGCPPDCARNQELQAVKWLESNREKIPPAIFKVLSEKLGLTNEPQAENKRDKQAEESPQKEGENQFFAKIDGLLKKFPAHERITRWQNSIKKIKEAGKEMDTGTLLDMMDGVLVVLDPSQSGEFLNRSLFDEFCQMFKERTGWQIIYPKKGDPWNQKKMEMDSVERHTGLPERKVYKIISCGLEKGDSMDRKVSASITA